ncbi:MAG: porin [Planctomycetaceae bacterium]|jgi:hypothetical protein|nr:porin [Planctomycetaceae bacterium]
MKKFFIFSLSLVLFSYLGDIFAHTENNSIYLGQEVCAPCEPVEEQIEKPCDAVTCDSEDFHFFKRNKYHRRSLLDNIEVFGWIQAGVYTNSRGNTITRTKGPNYKGRTVTQLDPTSGNGDLLSTVHSTDFLVNQIWLGVKKDADGTHGLDWGFAAEGYFGPEAWFAQSWGDAKFDYGWQDGDYYTAIPQLYAQLAYGDLSVKLGKFETILGFEALRAPDFFFFSHSYIFLLEPYSHSGAFFQYTPGDKWSLGVGYTTGTDTSIENAYDDHGFIGTISYQLTNKLNLSYAVMYNHNGYGAYPDSGDTDWDRYGLSGTNVYLHTVTANYSISNKWNYSFQWNYNDIKNREDNNHIFSYGIANYLTYQFNDRWGIGFRAEWAKNILGYETDISEYTLGVNWKPYSNISIRPEIRYDYSANKVEKPFNNGLNRDQFSGGITGIVSF